MKIREHFQSIISENNTNDLIIIECGAADGGDSRWMIQDLINSKKRYKFYAFEPDTRLNGVFFQHKNISNNKNVFRFNKAVGKIDAVVDFYLSDGWLDKNRRFVHQSSIKKPNGVLLKNLSTLKFEIKTVESITLDKFCKDNEIDKIDFIWADIQGAEADLISGGQVMFKNTKYFYTEYEKTALYDGAPDLNNLLQLLPNFRVVEDYQTDVLLKCL